jgi:hypothetical protein
VISDLPGVGCVLGSLAGDVEHDTQPIGPPGPRVARGGRWQLRTPPGWVGSWTSAISPPAAAVRSRGHAQQRHGADERPPGSFVLVYLIISGDRFGCCFLPCFLSRSYKNARNVPARGAMTITVQSMPDLWAHQRARTATKSRDDGWR